MLKIIITIILLVAIVILVAFFSLAYFSKNENPLGLSDNKLARCPQKPNCVCSEFDDDKEHYIKPIHVSEKFKNNLFKNLKDIIIKAGGEIIKEEEPYLGCTFTTSFFRFTDDLEFRVSANENIIHVRSASRVGHSDLKANRNRVEMIRGLFENE
jgi:uncharacterized protein (DUF1499 family)